MGKVDGVRGGFLVGESRSGPSDSPKTQRPKKGTPLTYALMNKAAVPSAEPDETEKAALGRFHLDSGASNHMTSERTLRDKKIRRKMKKSTKQPNGTVTCANGAAQTILGAVDFGRLTDVRVVDGLQANLISTGKLCDDGKAVILTKHSAYIIDQPALADKTELMTKIAKRKKDGLYDCDHDWLLHNQTNALLGKANHRAQHTTNVKTRPQDDLVLWHQRLGHVAANTIIKGVKEGILTGPRSLLELKSRKVSRTTDVPLCTTCAGAKFTRLAKPLHSRDKERAQHPFHFLAMDTGGPVRPATQAGDRWFLCIVDYYSNGVWTYPMPHRNDAAKAFKTFMREVVGPNKIHKVETIKSDGARELIYGELREYLLDNKIVDQQVTAPDASHSNGKAERAIRTLSTLTRALMLHNNTPPSLWNYAIKHAALLIRHLPSASNPGRRAPMQLLKNTKDPVELNKLRTFYAPVYFYDSVTAKNKSRRFSPRGSPGYFLGFSNKTMTSYFIRSKKTRRIHNIGAREVYFYEDLKHSAPLLPPLPARKLTLTRDQEEPSEAETPPPSDDEQKTTADSEEETSSSEEQINTHTDEEAEPKSLPSKSQGRPSRTRKPRMAHNAGASQRELINLYSQKRHALLGFTSDFAGYTASPESALRKVTDVYTPRTYQDAITCDDSSKWKTAIEDELNNLIEQHVFEIVKKPAAAKIIRTKWVFKVKSNEHGEVERFKGRLTAMGCSQIKGYNYSLTYSPTLRHATLRFVFWLIAENKMYVLVFDIKAAFLSARLQSKNPIYMAIPQGLAEHLNKNLQGKVCRLIKSIYGLKQAPRAFNKKLTKALTGLGFKATISDACLFTRKTKKAFTIIAVWVDDGIVASTSQTTVKEIITKLKDIFLLGKVEPLSYFLGMKIDYKQREGLLRVSSERYITEVVKRFRTESCKPRSTPQSPGSRLDKPQGPIDERLEFQAQRTYRELVGSMLYISITSRPDIAYAVSRLTRYMQDFDKTHWSAALYLLGYLQHTKEKSLHFRHSGMLQREQTQIIGYTDASWADEKERSRSTTGFLIYLGKNLIHWGSKLQKTQALSTAEAEYMAATTGIQEIQHLKNILEELEIKEAKIPIIYCDNEAAVTIMQGNGTTKSRTKHMRLRYHYIRQYVSDEHLEMRWISTDQQRADLLTKAVSSTIFKLLFHHLQLA